MSRNIILAAIHYTKICVYHPTTNWNSGLPCVVCRHTECSEWSSDAGWCSFII